MITPSQAEVRRAITEARTIVVKVGSSSLTMPSGHLDPERLNALVAALARVRLMGGRVVLVSSGAIAAGFGTLGFASRPTDVTDQQACAAVGQGLLMAQYEAAFSRYGLCVGQILLTASDTMQPQQYRNVRRTLDRLLDLGAVPIINENDSLASNEIRFGDNDRLSALIANIVVADALVLLTDVDSLYTAPPSQPDSRRIPYVPNVEDALSKIEVGGTEVLDEAAKRAAYQSEQALVALKNGGVTGVGLGESMQKHFYLPEAHTDFIFAVGGEELGLVFSIGVLLLFAAFFALSVYIAKKAADRLGRYLAFGMAFLVFFQAVFNLGVVCKALPTKGMALPFFSYGGTNMLSTFFAVGTILSVGIHSLRDKKREVLRKAILK